MLESADWLSHLLDLVPVSGQVEHHCLFGAPWRLELERSAAGEIPYHIVLAGSAILDDPDGGAPVHLSAGDILILPRGAAHSLHDGSGMTPGPMRQRLGSSVPIDENDGAGDRLDMLCGRFLLSPTHEQLLRTYFPERFVARPQAAIARSASGGTRAQLAALVALMRVESSQENLGGHAMLNGLSTALFTLALRLASESAEAPQGLLALAGHPRLAPALSALFRHPARAWTLPDLASLCGMSRATFVRQFQQRLRRSAAELLTDIRMTIAARELRASNATAGAIAETVGYQSEAAFQRAFKKTVGTTPAQFRKTGRAAGGR
ncbi:AraC family transcriptional regulator [Sphingomonas quercus]|uniref:AraC family transcriptional regulator n=1 Tax=Sphingomonas quercus TaxID=2842451 RepID=A0ABS6BNL1_9SPHN|nr:AraC family transcriptional regulator [Sphingomonas quercus]MBU3078775.1 AraC family transcriptional regulator [Sphingomonas quercus]